MFYSDVRLAKDSEICLLCRRVLSVLKHIQLQSRSISICRRQSALFARVEYTGVFNEVVVAGGWKGNRDVFGV